MKSPIPCSFYYDRRSGFAVCRCHRFGIFFCPSRETAEDIWKERHMGQDPTAATVGRVQTEQEA